ncbi:MAG: M81 family metallopeptidase [Planctomycetota bacterium]
MPLRIGLLGLFHESNTFAVHPTGREEFEQYEWLEGGAIVDAKRGSHNEAGGMLKVLEAEPGVEVVPLLYAAALPAGRITAEAERHLWSAAERAIAEAGALDGVLALPHGAAVGETEADFDGWWLARLRQVVGPSVPIVATLDPHANVSARMVAAVDGLVAYQTNPHVDQREVGRRAAELLLRTLRGECCPEVAYCSPSLIINIERQSTAALPISRWLSYGTDLFQEIGVLSTSLILGYPYADVAEMGSGVVVVADRRKASAESLAKAWAAKLWSERVETLPELMSIENAIHEASKLSGTIGLLDMGDNIGGGSYGDQTALTHQLMNSEVRPFFVNLADPKAFVSIGKAGEGATVDLHIGGRHEPEHCGKPMRIEGVVEVISDGRWVDDQPRHGGRVNYDEGPLAVVRCRDRSVVQVSQRAIFPVSAGQMTHVTLEPQSFRAIVLKGVHAPIAAYRDTIDHLVRVNSPGPTSAGLEDRHYQHRRRPMYPFELNTAWSQDRSALQNF